jgi:hypothetical protein
MSGNRAIGILYRGDRAASPPSHPRLRPVFDALAARGISAEPVVYSEEATDEVRAQIQRLAGVLVWVDPLTGDRDRSMLDELLRDIAAAGVWVSAHPDVVLRMGTKEVLVAARDLAFGSDTRVYRSLAALRSQLPSLLASGQPRVLKRHRGNAGIGVWKVQLAADRTPGAGATVEVQEAHPRGTDIERMTLDDFISRCEPYFAAGGCLVDQSFQPRVADGMVRCYFVGERVAGFATQEPEPGQRATGRVFGLPSRKTMYPPEEARFASLRFRAEGEWLPALRRATGVRADELPILWDADFLYGPVDAGGNDTHVLCEINVSCVIPFPATVPAMLARAVAARLRLT